MNVTFNKAENIRPSSGKYLVIDPCYVFGEPSSLWNKICEALFPNQKDLNELLMNVYGHRVYIFSTAWGDGVYPVYINHEKVGDAGVDAGLLSLVPEELLTKLIENNECQDSAYFKNSSLGVMVDLNNASQQEIVYDSGNLIAGNLEVLTGDNDYDDDDDDDDDSWYDDDYYDDWGD